MVLTGNYNSGSNDALVIAVAVAIPTAVVIVASVVTIVSVVAWLKRKRMRRLVGLSVNFNTKDGASPAGESIL